MGVVNGANKPGDGDPAVRRTSRCTAGKPWKVISVDCRNPIMPVCHSFPDIQQGMTITKTT